MYRLISKPSKKIKYSNKKMNEQLKRVMEYDERTLSTFQTLSCCRKYLKSDKTDPFSTVLSRSLWNKDSNYKECLMKIALLSKEVEMQHLLQDFRDTDMMVQEVTPTVLRFLANSFIENQFTRRIRNVKMKENDRIILKFSNSSSLREREFNALPSF